MQRAKCVLTVAGVLAAAFAGGALSHWVLSGGGAAYAQQAAPAKSMPTLSVVKCRKLELVDEQGRLRAGLSVVKGTASLSLYDEKAKPVLALPLRRASPAARWR